jgi:hypothetical protein
LIIDGKVVAEIPSNGRVIDIKVNVEDVVKHGMLVDPSTLTHSEVAEVLRTTTRMVGFLVREGFLKERTRSVGLHGYKANGVCAESLSSFLKDFTTFGRICRGLQRPTSKLKTIFEKMDVEGQSGWIFPRKGLLATILRAGVEVPQGVDFDTI